MKTEVTGKEGRVLNLSKGEEEFQESTVYTIDSYIVIKNSFLKNLMRKC